MITDHVFAQKYTVVIPPRGRKEIPLGGKIGISVNAVLFVILIIGVIWCLRRRKARRIAKEARSTTYPPVEPTLQMSRAPTAHELDSPNSGNQSAGIAAVSWPPIPPVVSPPAYDVSKTRPTAISSKTPVPQELPGSTFIYEHHPAFSATTASGSDVPSELSPTSPPRTPTQSAVDSEKKSPLLSPGTSQTGAQSPPFVSPLASPKLTFSGT